jgi:hypothetical protein
MIPTVKLAFAALGLAAAATPAVAQSWVYENSPRAWEPAGAVIAPAQRTTVDRTIIPQGNGRAPIVRERVVTENYNGVTAPLATNDYAYVPRRAYTDSLDSYAYVPRRAYEPVVETYAYVPRPQLPVAATESYAYVPSAVGPTVVYERDTGYCARRYRSYDAVSQTFMGFDGFRHSCP